MIIGSRSFFSLKKKMSVWRIGFVVVAMLIWMIMVPLAQAQEETPYAEPEARAWLNDGQHDIAGFLKRFETKDAVEQFLNKLCSYGVVYVGVVSTLGEVSGLRIYLPLNRTRRANIFELVNKKLSAFGFSTEDDKGQDTLTLWF